MTPNTKPNDFLTVAPVALVNLLSKILSGKDILRRLLTDPRMKRSWALIGQRCSGAQDYRRLWSEIRYALQKSRLPEPPRAKVRDHFLRIAKGAEKLANTIPHGPLDRLTYEFFPDDMAQRAFKVNNWSVLETDERDEVARRNIDRWPSMTVLLSEFARRASTHAEEAMSKNRTVDRDTYDRRLIYFIRHLAQYFRQHLDGPMEGTLANIASIVFERQIEKKLVNQILLHEKWPG